MEEEWSRDGKGCSGDRLGMERRRKRNGVVMEEGKS
jgi:hypothetical protein